MGFLTLLGLRSSAPTSSKASDGDARTWAREQILASLLVMAWVVEARDPYTGGHLWRVSRYAALLCERAGMDSAACARIAIGGFLHDLGKVGIPDAILRKRDKLSEEEYELVKTHPDLGARMLAAHPLAELVRDAVQLHHETPDGRGYPQGLRGPAIPVAARVVGICDAFDAMTSSRPYRVGMPLAVAMDKLESALGRQFDDELGRHMLAMGREGLLDHIAGHSDDGIPLRDCLMCGPTLVLRREHQAGDSIFCPNCGGGYCLDSAAGDGTLRAIATGRRGSAVDLTPQPDVELIRRFVNETARDLLGAMHPS